MKKEELRKVQFPVYDPVSNVLNNHLGYFHIWGRVGKEVRTYIDNESYMSNIEYQTMGILEDKKTGQVYTVEPDSITFLND